MNLEKINTYRRGLSVERLHTFPHILPYNNGFHSANAALIGMELCKLNHLRYNLVVVALLLHDIHEWFVGDIPSPVKRSSPDIAMAFKDLEKKWEQKNNIEIPILSIEEENVFKASDCIELGLFCLDEIEMGNMTLFPVLKNVVSYLEEYSNIIGVSGMISVFELTLHKFGKA